MQKLLVADYDSAIFSWSKNITNINIEAIKQFRKNGNKFVIMSSRDYKSLKKFLSQSNCEYDAIICNSGNIAIDNENNIIFKQCLSKSQVEDLKYYFKNLGKKYIESYHMYNLAGYTYTSDCIIDFYVVPKPFKRIKPMIEELKHFYPDIDVEQYLESICIRKKISMIDSIGEVSKYFKVKEKNIYTIGKTANDYEILEKYNGYNLLFSHPSLRLISNGSVRSVNKLIKKLENK